jgi:hypothetical protein
MATWWMVASPTPLENCSNWTPNKAQGATFKVLGYFSASFVNTKGGFSYA